jgi:hypothetical protein
MTKAIAATFLIMCLGCQKFEDFRSSDALSKNEGYFIKTLITDSELQNILVKSPQLIGKIGSLFTDDRYLYIGEYLKGIHVYDNRIPSAPKPLLFLQVPAMREFFIKDKTLVCDNGGDLISFNVQGIDEVLDNNVSISQISQDPNAFKLFRRVSNVFNFPNYPQVRNIYFECPDSAGYVTEWEVRSSTTNLNCYR